VESKSTIELVQRAGEVYTKIKYPEIAVLIRDHVGPLATIGISREADDQRGAGARSCLQAIPGRAG